MRNDIHAPGSPDFDPQAYRLVDVFDMKPDFTTGHEDSKALGNALDALAADGIVAGSHSWGCGHCGQTNLRYVALLVHDEANEWIFAGQDCLVGRFQGQTKASFQALKKAAELARAKQAKKAAWLALLESSADLVWLSYIGNLELGTEREFAAFAGQKPLRDAKHLGDHAEDHKLSAGLGFHFGTLTDIARKARQYGDLSAKQAAFVGRLVGEIEGKVADYSVKMAERAAKPQVVLQVTGKRQLVEGVIVSRKEVDNPFSYYGGVSYKLLVELADGSRVYGTEPSSLMVDKGDTVRFMAAVEVSKDDPSFGFYSRPTKAEVVAHAAVEGVAA